MLLSRCKPPFSPSPYDNPLKLICTFTVYVFYKIWILSFLLETGLEEESDDFVFTSVTNAETMDVWPYRNLEITELDKVS